MSDQYPSNPEVRAWAMARRPDLVNYKGNLPAYVIKAWDRAHPDRPYVRSQAFHGTVGGYHNHSCRCDPCVSAVNEYDRRLKQVRREERTEDLADELGDLA